MSEFKCCYSSKWDHMADMGHASSFDFILGRCNACGKYWANVFCTASAITGYEEVQAGDAELLLHLHKNAGPELKAALKNWLDKNI